MGARLRQLGCALLVLVLVDPAIGAPAPDSAREAELIARAAGGDAEAEFSLGVLYESRADADEARRADDLERARDWYLRAADRGQAEAMNNLGAMASDGRGTPPDDLLAASYYRRAAALGSVEGKTNLAILILRKRAPGTLDEGLRLLQQASAAGFPAAEVKLAQLLVDGVLVPPDDAHAAQLFEAAAQQGDAWGMYDWGLMLRSGTGTTRNLPLAADWIGRAADAGLAPALYDYAVILESGEGIPADAARAATLFARAAKLGEPRAASRIAASGAHTTS